MHDDQPYTLEELRREIDLGRQEILRGEGIVLRNREDLRAFFDDIKRRGRERLRQAQLDRGESPEVPQN